MNYTSDNFYLDEFLAEGNNSEVWQRLQKIYYSQNNRERLFLQLLEEYNNHYFILYCVGQYYEVQNLLDKAIYFYKRSLKVKPYIDTYLNLSNLHHKIDVNYSISLIEEALKIFPNNTRLYSNLASSYFVAKRFKDALPYYDFVVQHEKQNKGLLAGAYNNRGFALSHLTLFEECIDSYYAGYLLAQDRHMKAQLLDNLVITYDYLMDVPDNAKAMYLEFNKVYGVRPRTVRPYHHQVKRYGFVSGDFAQHVVTLFMMPLLKHIPNDVEIYIFNNLKDEDQLTGHIKTLNIKYFNIFALDDTTVADLIEDLEIDILFDLSGHTHLNRLGIFALKPAPVQVSYLAYPNTTGLKTIDYRITDYIADPINTKQFFTERLLRLDCCFVCLSSLQDLSRLPITIKSLSLPIVLGVTNKINKQNSHFLQVVKTVMEQLPNVKLVINNHERVLDLPMSRVEEYYLYPAKIDYLLNYNKIDLCLDTFPYSGTTTTQDSLLMGVPVVTLSIPNRHCANVTASILTHLQHPELVTHTVDEYIERICQLCSNVEQLRYYKQTLRREILLQNEPTKFANKFYQLIKTI